MEFYKANKFTLWQEENGEGGESNREGDQVDAEEERDDQEDDQAHGKDGTESQSKERREAATDVQDQGHSENDARHETMKPKTTTIGKSTWNQIRSLFMYLVYWNGPEFRSWHKRLK